MKISLIVFCFFFVTFLFSSCNYQDERVINGKGEVITQELKLDEITSINLKCAAKVIVKYGPTQSVKVIGQKNIIKRLNKEVKEGVWDIELENRIFKNYDLTIEIICSSIHEAVLLGSGIISLNNFENVSDLKLEISGSGDIEINNFPGLITLNAEITGSGNIKTIENISNINFLDVEITGSGDFNGFTAIANNTDIEITGSGNCETTTNNKLDIDITGSGTVTYKGNPSVSKDITGSGDVIESKN